MAIGHTSSEITSPRVMCEESGGRSVIHLSIPVTGPVNSPRHSIPKQPALRLWHCHRFWLLTFTTEATVRSDANIFIV